nr:DedA family protein [Metabacillus lacus]
MEQFGYIGILLLILIENIFPPIPSEIILTFGGFMTTTTRLTVLGVVAVSTLGSVLGAVILYWIGYKLSASRLKQLVEKWGHLLRLTTADVDKANNWFHSHGIWTVFFCRFVPLVRSLISLPAGTSRMNFGLFLLLTTFGTLIWNAVLVYIGVILGDSWDRIYQYMDVYSTVSYVLLGTAGAAAVFWFYRKKSGT